MSFKVSRCAIEKHSYLLTFQGHLDTYNFCDDVWTFILRDTTFKMENGQPQETADKIKIIACNSTKPGEI